MRCREYSTRSLWPSKSYLRWTDLQYPFNFPMASSASFGVSYSYARSAGYHVAGTPTQSKVHYLPLLSQEFLHGLGVALGIQS